MEMDQQFLMEVVLGNRKTDEKDSEMLEGAGSGDDDERMKGEF